MMMILSYESGFFEVFLLFLEQGVDRFEYLRASMRVSPGQFPSRAHELGEIVGILTRFVPTGATTRRLEARPYEAALPYCFMNEDFGPDVVRLRLETVSLVGLGRPQYVLGRPGSVYERLPGGAAAGEELVLMETEPFVQVELPALLVRNVANPPTQGVVAVNPAPPTIVVDSDVEIL